MRVLGSGAELGLGVGGKVIGERCFLGGMLVLPLDFALKNTIILPNVTGATIQPGVAQHFDDLFFPLGATSP